MATGTKRKQKPCSAMENMVFEKQAQICKAFASPVRLQILDVISKGECAVGDLHNSLDISKANLSQHLAILKSAGVLATRRDGKQIICSLAIPEVKQACALIRKVLQAQIEETRKILM